MNYPMAKVLRRAEYLLRTKGWTKGAMARREDGTACSPTDTGAVSFDLLGAVQRAVTETAGTNGDFVTPYTSIAFWKGYGSDWGALRGFNDLAADVKEVCAALHTAIGSE